MGAFALESDVAFMAGWERAKTAQNRGEMACCDGQQKASLIAYTQATARYA
jgi:hypothetical protein